MDVATGHELRPMTGFLIMLRSFAGMRSYTRAASRLRHVLWCEPQGASRGLCIRSAPAASALPLTKPQAAEYNFIKDILKLPVKEIFASAGL